MSCRQRDGPGDSDAAGYVHLLFGDHSDDVDEKTIHGNPQIYQNRPGKRLVPLRTDPFLQWVSVGRDSLLGQRPSQPLVMSGSAVNQVSQGLLPRPRLRFSRCSP